jgi:hypothetical protein
MQSACAVLYCHLRPLCVYHIFPHYLTNGTIFGKKLFNIKCILTFSVTFVSDILSGIQRGIIINIHRFSCEVPITLTSVLFWVITQRQVAILYRRFGTTYRTHPQGSKSHRLRGNPLPTFRDNVSVPSSRVKGSKSPRLRGNPLPTFRENVSVPSSRVKKSAILYRRFGKTYRSHCQGSKSRQSFTDVSGKRIGPIVEGQEVCNPLPTFREKYRSHRRGSRSLQSFTDVSGQRIGPILKDQEVLDFLTLEDGTDTLSRNVGKGLPLDAAL